MEIKTHYDYPPIPPRQFDWSAWIDGMEEGPVGRGPTEAHAVADLQEQLEECPNCGESVDPDSIFTYEDRDDSVGYYATETACFKCDPKRRALEREAAAESEYWSHPGWAEVFGTTEEAAERQAA